MRNGSTSGGQGAEPKRAVFDRAFREAVAGEVEGSALEVNLESQMPWLQRRGGDGSSGFWVACGRPERGGTPTGKTFLYANYLDDTDENGPAPSIRVFDLVLTGSRALDAGWLAETAVRECGRYLDELPRIPDADALSRDSGATIAVPQVRPATGLGFGGPFAGSTMLRAVGGYLDPADLAGWTVSFAAREVLLFDEATVAGYHADLGLLAFSGGTVRTALGVPVPAWKVTTFPAEDIEWGRVISRAAGSQARQQAVAARKPSALRYGDATATIRRFRP